VSSKNLNILFIGDIIGTPGIQITETLLNSYIQKYHIDFCIANGENLSDGKGLTLEIVNKLSGLGVNVLTGGNHLWDKWETRKVLAENRNVLRPLNYPRENPGNGYGIFDLGEKGKIGVLNLQGRVYMQPLDDPFKSADWALTKIHEQTKVVIIDFHAEATAEKIALGWFLDGNASAVIGTHTHIPTADARILPKGTAFISDVGMTGPYDSVIGMRKDVAIKRFIHSVPYKYEMASHDVRFCGAYVQVDTETGKAQKFESFVFPAFS
jgi:2',3'-cyclic-nucleotide 2'-phosphodiesterase